MSHDRRDRQVAVPISAERDAGFTLPEMLISVMISGILIVAIAMAFTTVIQSEAKATTLLAESKDITFVQTWLPVDLSSAIASYDEADEAALAAELAAGDPPIVINTPFTGTNVLTVVRPDLDSGTGVYYVVTYRYEEVNGEWRISRFEIRNPGTGAESVKTVGVAYEVPAPPAGWAPGMAPTHAADVTSRTAFIRPVGEDVRVKFESGKDFVSGGGGLSAENELPTNGKGGLTNPSAPPSRCGGRIALVIDTSGSVPQGNGGIPTENAAVSFIDGFTGTPTTLSLNGFDREAYGMNSSAPVASNGVRAPYVSVLNTGGPVDALKGRITALDDRDGSWNQALPDVPLIDGIHWDQIGSGTNWEDGLFNVFYDTTGVPYGTEQPELVVFITDGQPNLVRTSAGGSTGAGAGPASTAARAVVEDAIDAGTRVIGVIVGSSATNTDHVNNLKSVVGNIEWNGAVPGNAEIAQVFKGSFTELGPILRSILIAECGGTLTLQKRIDTGSGLVNPATGVWNYSSEIGDRPLDRASTSSITLDYRFGPSETSKTVEVIETPVDGYVFDRAECTANGVVVPSSPLSDPLTAGVSVTVSADKAVSCLMISRPT